MNNHSDMSNNLDRRKKIDYIFRILAKVLTWSSLFVLAILLYHVSITGIDRLSFDSKVSVTVLPSIAIVLAA